MISVITCILIMLTYIQVLEIHQRKIATPLALLLYEGRN